MRSSDVLDEFAPPLYRAYAGARAWLVDRKISREGQMSERAARAQAGVVSLKVALAERLAARGIGGCAHDMAPHVIYASSPSVWELHNIPSELSSVARLTPYFYLHRGFNDDAADWLEQRSGLDCDLVSWVTEVHARDPVDLFIGYLSGWQVSEATIRAIGALGIRTCGYHLDDKISFYGNFLGGRWSGPAALAAAYDLNLTSAPGSIAKYEMEGGLAAFWPEGANPDHFRPLDLPVLYDVTFVGVKYGFRPILVRFLKKNGIAIETFGPGWPNGAISADDMIKVYAQSRINLGFGGIGYSVRSQCVKGRDFEVPMCGALYLTSHNPELAMVYEIGREIVTYADVNDCVGKIRALLANPSLCDQIRARGRERALRDHTWAKRFRWVLDAFGLAGNEPRRDFEAGRADGRRSGYPT